MKRRCKLNVVEKLAGRYDSGDAAVVMRDGREKEI